MRQLGIFAKTFEADDFEGALVKIKHLGFSTFQFNYSCINQPALPTFLPEKILNETKELILSSGLSVAGVSATFNVIHPDKKVVKQGLEAFQYIAENAHFLGTNFLTICTGTRDPNDKWKRHRDNDSKEAWKELLQVSEKMIEIAEANNVFIGIEPEAANVVKDSRTARKYLDTLQSERLKVILDPANLFEQGHSQRVRVLVEEAIDLIGERIEMAHAKDRKSTGEVAPVGQGIIDFDHFIKQLENINFNGALVLHGMQAAEVNACISHLETCLTTGFFRR